jgi:curved DNA-binding protein CbpA
MSPPSPYDVLGISASASHEELRRAYRMAARRLHPDLHGGDARAELAMQRLNEAWSLVGSPQARQKHDRLTSRHDDDHPDNDHPDNDHRHDRFDDQFDDFPHDDPDASGDQQRWDPDADVEGRRFRHAGVVALLAVLLVIFLFTAFATTPVVR